MKRNLLIWGTGSQAHIVIEQCRYPNYRMVDDVSLESTWLKDFPKEEWDAFVAIGDNSVREKVTGRLRFNGYDLTNIVSRDSYVSPTVELGTGIYVAPMACVMTHTKVGDGCIINTNASVDHDCELGDFVHISPCAGLGGNVYVGDRTWVGLGSSINHKVSIAHDIVLASGSSVKENLDRSHSLYAGNPAVRKKDI
jgi:sugar O-acyltransferase (sialic acid O-acetyltransferase NeuD family)